MAYDPMQDRNYLMGLLQRSNPHDPLRQAAERQWELLNQREAQGASLGATRANLEETIRSREGAQREATAQREERAKETAGYREDILSQRAEAAKNAEAARVLSALQYETDPKVTKQVLAQFYAGHGITPPTPAPDAAGEAARRARVASGQSVAPTPATGASPTTGVPGTTPAGAVGAAPIGGAPPTTTIAPSSFIDPATGLSTITGHRPGNFAVPGGEVRPPGTVGYINGRPAGDVLAEGALRTGVTPQSESGRAALAARLSSGGLPGFTKTTEPTGTAAAAAPTAGATPPTPAGAETSTPIGKPWEVGPEEAARNRAAIGATIGKFINLPGAHQAEVENKRTMAGFLPPPSPLGPESGGMNFADITRPSANLLNPPVQPPMIDEEQKRRLAIQTQQQ